MKRLFITALMAAALPFAALAQDERPQVMVLGMFHFTGGGSDYVNSAVDDYFSPQRQAEIDALVVQLAEFNPTKIVVELTPDGEDHFNESYQAYLGGNHELTVNERQQIGMRLAARLGHERLYAADYSIGMDFDAMMGAAAENGQTHLSDRLPQLMGEIQTLDESLNQAGISIGERLRVYNTAEFLAAHNVYLTLAQMGSVENPAGANEMAGWWGRNLHTFAQIAQLSEPGDRILVIYGSGHKFLLDQFFQDAAEFEWVDALNYLPTE
ncbi:hypothetical protein HXX25_05975 [Hyphobacterium sp. CCMP332]|uniref:DUF5694 domain-containing protein n=1 Tax=Hyphobacterium sp. CCMP332 TaxID=2749086 RepID=UPI00164F61EC|nr:DUF5694 domain-containing protein [Hyphobacterium sp. CCMP332]QNL18933.1 hypothetical protein HXX25_05975 [Hyphobacterium sp. CCMP332]